jgi:CheY-like chemotaxis protein
MKKIFAIDDDRDMLDLMTKALSPYGYSMAYASRCKGALEEARDYGPEIVLLDVMLPDGAGYQVSRAIRADPKLYKTPVLFVSAMADDPEVEYALKQGGDGYLTKPFSLKDLVVRLQEMEILAHKVAYRSPGSGLASLEAIEREIDHRIFQKRGFSLCFISIDSFEPFILHKGREEGAKVLGWMGDILQRSLQDWGLSDAFLAHLGREYFLVLLHGDAYKKYCSTVESSFSIGVSQFYKDFELEGGYIIATKRPGTYAGYSLMSVRIDVAVWKDSNFANARDMLHQIKEAHKKSEGGEQKRLFKWDQYKKW